MPDPTLLIRLFGGKSKFSDEFKKEIIRFSEEPLGSVIKRYPEAAIKYGIEKPLELASKGVGGTLGFATNLIEEIGKEYAYEPKETLKRDLKWGLATLGVGLGAYKGYKYLGKPLLAEAQTAWKGAKDFGKKWFVDDITATTSTPRQPKPIGRDQGLNPQQEIPYTTGDPDTLDALRQKALKEYYDAGYTVEELDFITENIDDALFLQGPNNLRKVTDEAYGVDNPLNKMDELIESKKGRLTDEEKELIGWAEHTEEAKKMGVDVDALEKELYEKAQKGTIDKGEMPETLKEFFRSEGKALGLSDEQIELTLKELNQMGLTGEVPNQFSMGPEELVTKYEEFKALLEIAKKRDIHYGKIQSSMATEELYSKLQRLKESDPEQYKSFMNKMGKKPNKKTEGMTIKEIEAKLSKYEDALSTKAAKEKTKLEKSESMQDMEKTLNEFFEEAGGGRRVVADPYEFEKSFDDLFKSYKRGVGDRETVRNSLHKEIAKLKTILDQQPYLKVTTTEGKLPAHFKWRTRNPDYNYDKQLKAQLRIEELKSMAKNDPWLLDTLNKVFLTKKQLKELAN